MLRRRRVTHSQAEPNMRGRYLGRPTRTDSLIYAAQQPGPSRAVLDTTQQGKGGRLRTLGDCLDSFEGAEHVTPVAMLP
jgi:hypothetical protein